MTSAEAASVNPAIASRPGWSVSYTADSLAIARVGVPTIQPARPRLTSSTGADPTTMMIQEPPVQAGGSRSCGRARSTG